MTPEARFHNPAPYYLSGRPPYAPALIRRVVQLCGLGPGHRILDLGCGPGLLALAFAPFVGSVLGIDPEPEMLRIARGQTATAGLPITFQPGSSHDLDARLGSFRLVVIGRAFHWMDRQETLLCLDRLIEAGGAVVLFGDSHPNVPDNAWCPVFESLTDRHAGEDAARKLRRAPGWLSHEAVLLDSPFAHLERLSVIERRLTPVERIVDRALSLSSVWQGQAGPGIDTLANEVRQALAAFAREGLVPEVVESEALIARRGAPSRPTC